MMAELCPISVISFLLLGPGAGTSSFRPDHRSGGRWRVQEGRVVLNSKIPSEKHNCDSVLGSSGYYNENNVD